jgi:MinD-like ATPase involved in chromosome partitioning or flagellar assembly
MNPDPIIRVDYNDIVVIVGNYGSGKTEVSINLAVMEKQAGKTVQVADLDLVNLYFRTREARHQLRMLGIDVILPQEHYMKADLPILSPGVAAMIRTKEILAILDVGGDGVGATVLAALAESFKNRPAKVLQVVNPFRPYTDTLEGCEKIRTEIETNAKMKITGLVSNANMMQDTTMEHIRQGYDFILRLAKKSALPLEFITIPDALEKENDMTQFSCPLLTIKRQLVPPWLQAEELT